MANVGTRVVSGLVDGRRHYAAVAAATLFAGIFVTRSMVGQLGDAITFLYVVPIVILAIAYGVRAGLLAGAGAFAMFSVWALTNATEITALGYINRAAVFLFVGGLTGAFASDIRGLEHESSRLFNLSHDMLCVAGFDGYFKRINPAFERILGYNEAELLSRPFLEFVHPDDRDRTAAEAAAIGEGKGTVQFRNRYVDKRGELHWIEWTSIGMPEEDLIYAVARDVTERKTIEDELHRLSSHDSLTGLLNRRSFNEALERQLAQCRRHGQGGAVLMMDLDRLKQINDELGHAAGDAALCEVARILSTNLREGDVVARHQDRVAARLGGDEFAVLLPGADAAGADAVAERLVEAVSSATLTVQGRQVELDISVGVALFDEKDSPEANRLMAVADRAMYAAKAAGGGAAVTAPAG